jgi:hypothetical protein
MNGVEAQPAPIISDATHLFSNGRDLKLVKYCKIIQAMDAARK